MRNRLASLRRYDLDALKALAIMLVLFYHSAKIFDEDTWIIQNDAHCRAATVFVVFLLQWCMPLFFLIAGMSAFLALEVRSTREFLRERALRLFVPFVFGILLIVPPQVYIERISWWAVRRSHTDFAGSFLSFYPQFFTSCYPKGNFTWNHLWFILYLFLYSAATLPLLHYLKNASRGQALVSKFASAFAPGRRIFLLALPILAIELALRGFFPDTHALYNDWANHAHFAAMIVIGFMLVADERFNASLAFNRALALILAIALTVLYLLTDATIPGPPRCDVWGLLCWHGGEWCWLAAIIGYGQAYLNRRSAAVRYASDIAYPFYILHQTVIVLLAYYVIRWHESIPLKFVAISGLALAITLTLCAAARLSNTARFMLGMPARKQMPVVPPLPALMEAPAVSSSGK